MESQKVKCKECRKEFPESKMHKHMIYYNISAEAEELRRNGCTPWVFGQGILQLHDRLNMTKEQLKYLLDRDFELRLVGYTCEKCYGCPVQ